VEFANCSGDRLVNQILNDRYQIKSLLGHRTGRRTFLATDIETELPVVVKLLLFGPDFTWDDLKLFEREAQTLQTLNHPFIPRYLDSFEVNTLLGKGFAFVQSYIEAQSLQNWVEQGRHFSEAELREIAKKLLDILVYLHLHQPPVIHRDIKPSNVLLGDRSGNNDGDVYLVDFGSVQTVAHHGTVTVVGTYGYMPPEQFGGKTTSASDLYSLGATLICLATGQEPANLPQKNMQIEFESLVTLNCSFVQWIRWLTYPDLSKRPSSATQALHPLQQGFQEQLVYLSTQSNSLDVGNFTSRIQLQKTPITLEIEVPSDKLCSEKIDAQKKEPAVVSCFGCVGSLMSIFLFTAYLGWVGFILWVLFIVVVGALYSKLFGKTRTKVNRSYKVTLQREHSSIAISVTETNENGSINITQTTLNGLYAGHNDVPRYRLSFSCSSDSLYVTGNREEIQWLCDELNEWTGIEVQYSNYQTTSV